MRRDGRVLIDVLTRPSNGRAFHNRETLAGGRPLVRTIEGEGFPWALVRRRIIRERAVRQPEIPVSVGSFDV